MIRRGQNGQLLLQLHHPLPSNNQLQLDRTLLLLALLDGRAGRVRAVRGSQDVQVDLRVMDLLVGAAVLALLRVVLLAVRVQLRGRA